jgi:hypothetical protein
MTETGDSRINGRKARGFQAVVPPSTWGLHKEMETREH